MNLKYSPWQNQAKLKFDTGEYQESLSLWEKCLELDPQDITNYAYIGLIQLLQGEREFAQEIWFTCLLNGTEDDLNNIGNLIYEIANHQQQQNNLSLATQLYEQVLEFNESHALSYLNLGYLLAITGKLENAFKCWQRATKIDPTLSIAYYHQARQWKRLKDYQPAIDYYQKALQFEPENIIYWHDLGICLLNNEQLNCAINCQKKCLEIEANFVSNYGELGYIYLLKLDLDIAFDYWTMLVSAQQKLFNNYLCWLEKNNQDSLQLIKSLIKNLITKNNHLNLATVIANLFYQRSQFQTAIYYYHLAIANNNQLAENYYYLILSLIYTQQRDKISPFVDKLKIIDQDKYQQIIKLFNNKITEENEQLIKAPQNYHEKLFDYLKKQNILLNNYYPIYSENCINLKPPKTPEKLLDPSFQFPAEIKLPDNFVGILPQGRFWLREDEASSAVISNDNQLIGDLSPESPALSPGDPNSHPSNHSLLKNKYLPPIEYIDGTVVILVGLLNKVYFHWLLDIVPRFKLLELSGINLEKVDYFLVDNSCAFQQETLSMLGIKSEKIKSLSFPLHLQAKQLIIPSFPGTIAWPPLWSCDYLRELILGDFSTKKTLNKRIYISRKNANSRRLINEAEIIRLLKKYAFEIINLEQLSGLR